MSITGNNSARARRSLLAAGLLAALAWAGPAAAAKGQCYRVTNVDPLDVLFIRSARDHRSAATGAIAPDHRSPVIGTGPCLPAGASRRQQWCPVDYYPLPEVRISGFIKAYFVKDVACDN